MRRCLSFLERKKPVCKKKSHFYSSFSRGERALWCTSLFLILAAFLLFDRENHLTLCASIVGVTSLIFCAKGNPAGQLLMLIFSVLYGIISFTYAYYGEMLTYLGMTAPMALFSLISWCRNSFEGKKSEVAVNQLCKTELLLLPVLTILVTLLFALLLHALHTANLVPSTISVATSFLAVYLTFRRSAFFALAYAANDLVLIVLWSMAALEDRSYLSVLVCFAAFLINDLYGFFNWRRMKKRQAASARPV